MATIGYVTKREDGRYEGELRTLSLRASIAILPVGDKQVETQPDFRVMAQGIEIGAGWQRIGQTSGKEYISLSISATSLLSCALDGCSARPRLAAIMARSRLPRARCANASR